jgi:cytochrome o ubiquinol oxidase subunit 2
MKELSDMVRKLRAGLLIGAALCLPTLLGGCEMALFDPKGQIGVDERNLILIAVGLMLLVVIPAIFMALLFAWRYRASNDKAVYAPDWDFSAKIEAVVWGAPILIVVVLSVVCWKSTHALDPARPIASDAKPIRIEVVALDWKWLFIYPDQRVASVNEAAFPVDAPVRFDITSATVMNSFFIPQLGSQIYAMAGMDAKLNLIANAAGVYDGVSANFSGSGFSGMSFKALALSNDGFDAWVAKVRQSSARLSDDAYAALAKPSEDNPVQYYAEADPRLFGDIIGAYMKAGMEPICTGVQSAR